TIGLFPRIEYQLIAVRRQDFSCQGQTVDKVYRCCQGPVGSPSHREAAAFAFARSAFHFCKL
ncbi:MAG: hypothetical protein EBX67_01400, partial [Betaproteobacteria bacterium]|nr:hypothetical protein [Betaproteobacteria bacterium]